MKDIEPQASTLFVNLIVSALWLFLDFAFIKCIHELATMKGGPYDYPQYHNMDWTGIYWMFGIFSSAITVVIFWAIWTDDDNKKAPVKGL